MKAVSKIIIPLLLSLAGVVLAAPHQTITSVKRSINCYSSVCKDRSLSCREMRGCVARVSSPQPPIYDSNSFQYW